MPGRRRSRMGASLFAIYAVVSLLPVGVLGAVLVRGYHDDGLDRALDQGRAQTRVIQQMAIAPAISGADLTRGLSTRQQERLRSATDLAIFHNSVLRLRVLSFDGEVAFSDDGSVMRDISVADPAFRAAADGDVDARVVGGAGSISETSIRVLQPVVSESSGQSVGVLEVYLPYQEIADRVQADTSNAVKRLAVGLVGLYALMALVSWWTTRALRRHAADHEYQALHDPLTGLPNRELFRRNAEEALSRARAGEHGALVLVDLDHFKEVNDTLGHHAGDELLQVVAQRLGESVRTDDTVARLGGDEFGMILPGHGHREDTVELLARVRRELGREMVLDDATLIVEASFGVCFYPDDATTVEGLLQHADAAMYQGKHGPTGVVVYEPTTSRPAMDALVMQRELREALDRDEFVLHYQPKLDLAGGRVTCVEALVRWRHPVRGLLYPADFLPVAERSEIIEPFTSWVLARALRDYTAWTAAGHDWAVAVNVSARNLSSLDFAVVVRDLLRHADVPADRLFVEVTETALAFDTDVAVAVLNAMARDGIRLSIDDFGTGFTVLSQLRSMDIAEVKIDRIFVSALEHNDRDRAIVRSVIDLAHTLGCVATAEGVETQECADWLADAGCDHGQGYLWQRPVPWTAIEDPVPAATDAPTIEGAVP